MEFQIRLNSLTLRKKKDTAGCVGVGGDCFIFPHDDVEVNSYKVIHQEFQLRRFHSAPLLCQSPLHYKPLPR